MNYNTKTKKKICIYPFYIKNECELFYNRTASPLSYKKLPLTSKNSKLSTNHMKNRIINIKKTVGYLNLADKFRTIERKNTLNPRRLINKNLYNKNLYNKNFTVNANTKSENNLCKTSQRLFRYDYKTNKYIISKQLLNFKSENKNNLKKKIADKSKYNKYHTLFQNYDHFKTIIIDKEGNTIFKRIKESKIIKNNKNNKNDNKENINPLKQKYESPSDLFRKSTTEENSKSSLRFNGISKIVQDKISQANIELNSNSNQESNDYFFESDSRKEYLEFFNHSPNNKINGFSSIKFTESINNPAKGTANNEHFEKIQKIEKIEINDFNCKTTSTPIKRYKQNIKNTRAKNIEQNQLLISRDYKNFCSDNCNIF